jgi:steroid 5-alpha reductase family enzyme
MIHWEIYLSALLAMSLFAIAGWIFSLARDNVSHADSMWGLYIGMATYTYTLFFYDLHERNILILILVTIWAIRLCSYITWRNINFPEDQRLQTLRTRNQAFFWLKSVYLLFGFYAGLTWIISISLFASIQDNSPLNTLDYIGAGLVIFGLAFETIADFQLAYFKQNPLNESKVIKSGLWQYCRHPNYFGECVVWWGFYCIALGTGAWWSIISPLLVTFLLTAYSGIAFQEKLLVINKPDYSEYMRKTNAFFPWKP